MAQFEIIKDVTVSLTKLITESFKEAGYRDIEIYNCLPTEENIKKMPAVSIFLSAVVVDKLHRERDTVLVSETNEDGEVIEYETMPPMVVWMYYILSAFGKTPQEEHVLLGLAMRVLQETAMITAENFVGEALGREEQLPIRVVDEGEFGYDETMAFWRSIGEPVRPAVLYRVGGRLHAVKPTRIVKRIITRGLKIPGPE